MTISREHLIEVKKFLPKHDLKNISKSVVKAGCVSMDGDMELRRNIFAVMTSVENLLECYEDIEKAN